ncbi:hypothetical protein SDC9_91283 [bioreactor metagenome]|uniref:Uncharacterized protein n=1 Tax=bioreactor metagenome TaxID=1076179 RepID=A0A645A495_9ZZZZ
MKRGVPFQMVGLDFKVLSKFQRLGGEQRFPCVGVIIAQPSGVLPPQGYDGRPYVSGVRGYFLRDVGQDERLVTAAKQAMAFELLDAGTVGDVVQILFVAADCVQILLQRDGDKLRGVLPVRICEVILILKQLLTVGEFPQNLVNKDLLFFCGIPELTAVFDQLHSLTGGDIFYEVVKVGGSFRTAALDIRPL